MRVSKRGIPLKSGYFTDTGTSNMKTVADRQCTGMLLIITRTGDDLLSSTWY